ncbi:MAG: hypothetical protein EOO20_18275 [Chryseobacterium sp.]|nr:MAG: hypothetical protein EOO20_18275 [Chryseobacterium sp.]
MVNDGSYTYILTAKHLFEGTKTDIDGNPTAYDTADGEQIAITRVLFDGTNWTEAAVPFEFHRQVNYFASPNSDAAILKIDPIDGFGSIYQTEIVAKLTEYSLVGLPEIYRNRQVGNRNAVYHITHLNGLGANTYNAQLQQINFARDQIAGMSGGGILKIEGQGISIIGIQSEVTHQTWAGGQIEFVPIDFFNRIISDLGNPGVLSPLYPPYYSSFEFLREDAFKLEVDAIEEENIVGARTLLRNKAEEIVNSDITPEGIKRLFEQKLLILETETACFSYKTIWIAWLEFLTILNIVKYDNLQINMLSEVFDIYRLKYIDGYGWTDIRAEFGKSDYIGLKEDSVVFVASKTPPKTTYVLKKGRIIDIAKPYDKRGFKTNAGLNPFTSFDFVHLEYFKVKCIIEKLHEYENMTEDELLAKLKLEYHGLFG